METEPAGAPNPNTNPNPAANALKHGFCAARILAPETLARADAIRAELTTIHEPWSAEETEAIAQIAMARAQQFEVELAMSRKVADEKARAAELYERSAQARFLADLARFHERPALHLDLLGMTWHGAAWLENVWSRVAAELVPDPSGGPAGLPFTLACEAAAALGSAWQVDQASAESAWLMARYVRIAPDPEAALELWVERSKAPDGPAYARIRARRFLAQAPADPAVAAADLAAKAASERSRLSMRAKALRANDETARDRAAEAAVGTGLGDPGLEREFRLLSRYLTSARNRADRLQRRLDTLKKERKSLAYRLQRDAEREARRLKRESEKAMRQYETESARMNRERAAFHAVPGDPEYEGLGAGSQLRDGFVDFVEDVERDDAPVVMAQAIDPVRSDMSQTVRLQWDQVELRNENRDSSEDEGEPVGRPSADPASRPSADPAGDPANDPAGDPANDPADGERESGTTPAWMDRNAPLKARVRMMRYRDWGDPAEVFEDEADILRQVVALPESFERQVAVQAFFGSEKVLRRCWKAYRAWALPTGNGQASAG